MHDIPIEAGFLIGLLVSLILYGMYCILFILTLYTRRKCDTKSHIITGAISVLFVMCTTVIGLHLATCYRVLIQSPSTNPAAVILEPFQAHHDWYPIKDIFLLCSNFIAESLLIWRLFNVWSKNWKVLIVPAVVMTVAVSGGLVGLVVEFIVYLSSVQNARKFIPVLVRSIPIGWTAALVNNLFCTILIVWKLWRIARVAEGYATARLANQAVNVLVESGALYTSTLLCVGILSATGMDGVSFILVTLLIVVIGIAPTSIILRLNLVGVQKRSGSIQNDALSGPNQPRLVHSEVGINTISEPVVFSRPSLPDLTSSTSRHTWVGSG